MTGKKRLLAEIAEESDITRLRSCGMNFRRLAEIAAAKDATNDWSDYCDLAEACQKRIEELKGEAK